MPDIKIVTLDSLTQYMEALPRSYIYTTLPCLHDSKILDLIPLLKNASPGQKHSFQDGVTNKAAQTLNTFATRMSMLCVRKKSQEMLLAGLAALELIYFKNTDYRYLLIDLSLLYHSTIKLNLDETDIFQKAVQLAGTKGAILDFLKREPSLKEIECMGHHEVEGPSGLIYWSGEYSTIPEGLLYEKQMIPEKLQVYWDSFEDLWTLKDLFQVYQIELKKLAKPAREEFEALLLQAWEAGSRDAKVILGLGWLHSQKSAAKLKGFLPLASDIEHVYIITALWFIEKYPEAEQGLLHLFQSTDHNVRESVVIVLRKFKSQKTVITLKLALQDPYGSVRSKAIDSILFIYGIPHSQLDWPRFLPKLMLKNTQAEQEIVEELEKLLSKYTIPK